MIEVSFQEHLTKGSLGCGVRSEMSGGRTGNIRRETTCNNIYKHNKPMVQLKLRNVPRAERLLVPNADFAWFDLECGYVRGTVPAGCAQRSAACTGAEVQAGAAGRAVSPLVRCPLRGHGS